MGEKAEEFDMSDLHPGMQRLIFDGRQLEDLRVLSEYKIVKQSVIHLFLRLSGS